MPDESRSWTNPAVRIARAVIVIMGFTPGAVVPDPQLSDPIEERIEVTGRYRRVPIPDAAFLEMEGRDPTRRGGEMDPSDLLESADEVRPVAGREAVVEDRLALHVDPHAAFRDIADEDDRSRRVGDAAHPVLVRSSAGPGERQRRKARVARRALEPGAVMAFIGVLEALHDDRLHRPLPHLDPMRVLREHIGRGIETQSETDAPEPDAGTQEDRRRLDRATRHDDGPRADVDRDLATSGRVGRLDATGLAPFDEDPVGPGVEEEPCAGTIGVRQIRDERRLLRIVYAPEEAEVASPLAPAGVPRDDVVVETHPKSQGLASAAECVVRRVHDAFLRGDAQAGPHVIEDPVELRPRDARHAASPLPLRARPPP